MEFYELVKSQKDGVMVRTPQFEYNLKANAKKQIVLKGRSKKQFYFSNQLDKFDPPAGKKDCKAVLERVKSWIRCPEEHNLGQEQWYCTQDHDSCPTCAFMKLVKECGDMCDGGAESCAICGSTMALAYTGDHKKKEMPSCSHTVCHACMEHMLDTSAENCPELEGYKINCPFCRAENIISYN